MLSHLRVGVSGENEEFPDAEVAEDLGAESRSGRVEEFAGDDAVVFAQVVGKLGGEGGTNGLSE